MKRQVSRATVSSMTDRRIDGTLLARPAIKKALRLLCAKFRRNCKIQITENSRLITSEDELWNLSNENLENELKELAMKMKR